MTHIHLPNGTVLKSKYKDYPPICEVCGNPIYEARTKRQSLHPGCRFHPCQGCESPIPWNHTWCQTCYQDIQGNRVHLSKPCRDYIHGGCWGSDDNGGLCWCPCHEEVAPWSWIVG